MRNEQIKGLAFLVLVFFLATTGPGNLQAGHRITFENGYFYVDGQPFFIRAVGYAPWRPHQWPDPPKEQVDPVLIEADFKRIKQAGFNTIRSWGSLNQRELRLAEEYGLMVIQGIWLNPNIDYANPLVQEAMLKELSWEVGLSKDFPNILMYMPITEPKPNAILGGGVEKTEAFFRKIRETIQNIDPRPVSMDSWLSIAFMNHSMWDVVTFNTFAFAPASVSYALGFKGYNEWLRVNVAKDKPYFVGETGGYSVSPSTFGVKGGGAGGFTEKEQSQLNLACLKDIEDAGAIGWTLVSWIDTWHYPEDPDTHDPNEPWEWDGIVGFKSDTDLVGTPRKIFYDLPAFNRRTAKRFRERRIVPPSQQQVKFKIRASPRPFQLDQDARIKISAKDDNGKPISHQRVRIGYFIPEPWQEASDSGKTDEHGELSVLSPIRVMRSDQVLIVAVGAVDESGRHTGGDIIFLHQ